MVRRKLTEFYNYLTLEHVYTIKESPCPKKIFDELQQILKKYQIKLCPVYHNRFKIQFGIRDYKGKEPLKYNNLSDFFDRGLSNEVRIVKTELLNLKRRNKNFKTGGFPLTTHRASIEDKLKYLEKFGY